MSLGEAYAAQAAQKLREDSPPQRRLRKQYERAYVARFSFPNHVGGYDHAERAQARHRRELLARSREAITLGAEHFRNRLAVAFSVGPKPATNTRKLRRDFKKHPRRDLPIGGTTEGPNGLPLLKYLPPASFGKKRVVGEVRPKVKEHVVEDGRTHRTVFLRGQRCKVANAHAIQNETAIALRALMPADLSVNAVKCRRPHGVTPSGDSSSGWP